MALQNILLGRSARQDAAGGRAEAWDETNSDLRLGLILVVTEAKQIPIEKTQQALVQGSNLYTTCCQRDCVNFDHLVFKTPREAKRRAQDQLQTSFKHFSGLQRQKIQKAFVELKFSDSFIVHTDTFITLRNNWFKYKNNIVVHR